MSTPNASIRGQTVVHREIWIADEVVIDVCLDEASKQKLVDLFTHMRVGDSVDFRFVVDVTDDVTLSSSVHAILQAVGDTPTKLKKGRWWPFKD